MTSLKSSALTRVGSLGIAVIIAAAGVLTSVATPAIAMSSGGIGTTTFNVQHASQTGASATEIAVLNQINAYRAQHGLKAVTQDDNFSSSARGWAQHLTESGAPAGHPAGGNFYENVAYSLTPERAVDLWIGSPSHNSNLLANISHGGVGVVDRHDGTYAVVFRAL